MPEPDLSAPGQPGQVADAIDRVADLVDNLVPVSETVANQVLVDDSRANRWTGALFGGRAVALVPWTAYLAVTLPSHIKQRTMRRPGRGMASAC
jgi:galactokinase